MQNKIETDRKTGGPKRPRSNEGDKQQPLNNKWKRKNLSLLLLIILISIAVVKLVDTQNPQMELSFSEFKHMMSDASVTIKSAKVQRIGEGYIFIGEKELNPEEQAERKGKGLTSGKDMQFKVILPEMANTMDGILDTLIAHKVKVEFVKETRFFTYLSTLFPIFLLLAFFWLMARQGGQMGGPRGIFSFGKSRAKLMDEHRPKLSFMDVAGCDEAKQELGEIIDFLKDPKKFSNLGGRIPRGVLLLGPPGTGKTLLAKAVAGEAGVPFFSMSGSDFVEMFVGVGASRVRDLFEQGKKHAPCIIFIDEIDAVGRHRGAGLGGGHDEREQTLNQLLVEMDGFNANDGVILIAATNRPDVLDPALLRPGRFDRQIVVDPPDAKGREAILNVHLKKRNVPLADDVDTNKIARGTPGLSGADIENLVNEACLLAARFGSDKVVMIDFEEAKDKIMMGIERVSRILSEEEKRTTAYHEAGHALMSKLVEHADPLHKITIIPRGRALGVTFSLPEKDRYTVESRFILDNIAILLGGRSAEFLMFNQKTTGAANDIERASDLARKYVCEWGMSEELGPMTYGKKKEEIFLGREINQHRDYSEATAIKIDKEVSRIVHTQLERVTRLLSENKQKLTNLAEALLEHEVLEGDEIDKALRGEIISETRKSRGYLRDSKRMREEKEIPIPPNPDEAPPEAVVGSTSAPEKTDPPNVGGSVDAQA